MKSKWLLLVIILLSIVINFPYVYGVMSSGADTVFAGFLINPIDANSYLAKMYQGWMGEWLFNLPYTAEPGNGAPLFLFYLFLGHISRLLSMPLIITYHLSRWSASVFLWLTLWRFFHYFYSEDRYAKRAFLIVSLGSGMGWAFFLSGHFTSDFWVVETYPFLSTYANPHFPLGLAIILWILILADRKRSTKDELILFGLGSVLAIVQPFGVVVVIAALCGAMLVRSLSMKKLYWHDLPLFMIGGILLLGYQYWIIHTDPLLSLWNIQNQTPAPPLWDVIVSLSPALLLVPFCFYLCPKTETRLWRFQSLMIGWIFTVTIFLFIPFNLQRRLMTGLYVPVASLAVIGVDFLQKRLRLHTKAIWLPVVAMSILTNLVVVLSGFWGIHAHDQMIYISRDDFEMYQWIAKHTPDSALILASPESGLFIPAYTGRRVIYGHPFETVNAEKYKELVEGYFQGVFCEEEAELLLRELRVDYIFRGPRERKLGNPSYIWLLRPVHQTGDTILYKAGDEN